MSRPLKGRLIGPKFKTIEGARKRAAFENAYEPGYRYTVVPADAFDTARGYPWRIHKVKRT